MFLKSAAADLPECLVGKSQRGASCEVSTLSSRPPVEAPPIDCRSVFNTPERAELASTLQGVGRWEVGLFFFTVTPGERPRVRQQPPSAAAFIQLKRFDPFDSTDLLVEPSHFLLAIRLRLASMRLFHEERHLLRWRRKTDSLIFSIISWLPPFFLLF